MKEYVLGFLFSYGFEDVVLILKNRPQWQAGKMNGLGGGIENTDSSPVSAMQREFKEECGADIDNWHKFAIMEGPNWRVYCFAAFRPTVFLKENVQTTTDEGVGIESVQLLHEPAFSAELLPNVPWLCAMAKAYTLGRQPALTIVYPHEQ